MQNIISISLAGWHISDRIIGRGAHPWFCRPATLGDREEIGLELSDRPIYLPTLNLEPTLPKFVFLSASIKVSQILYFMSSLVN